MCIRDSFDRIDRAIEALVQRFDRVDASIETLRDLIADASLTLETAPTFRRIARPIAAKA